MRGIPTTGRISSCVSFQFWNRRACRGREKPDPAAEYGNSQLRLFLNTPASRGPHWRCERYRRHPFGSSVSVKKGLVPNEVHRPCRAPGCFGSDLCNFDETKNSTATYATAGREFHQFRTPQEKRDRCANDCGCEYYEGKEFKQGSENND